MRLNYRRKRSRSRESGSFWLSFSDMMSVLVLVFIFVIFSMMLSLANQTEQLQKIEDEYAVALLRMEQSEQALKEKEGLLSEQQAQLVLLNDELEGQKLVLALQEKELNEQEALIAKQQEEIETRVIILEAEKSQLDALLQDAQAKIELLGDQEEKLASSQALVLSLTGELEKANEENRSLSQRLALLKNNEASYQAQIDSLLLQIDQKKKELESLGIDYMALLSASSETENQLLQAQSVMQSQSEALFRYQEELEETQLQLERMVGVKAQIIEALSTELERRRIVVSVDEQTGAITLPSETLFDVGANWLSERGRNDLDQFLPVYIQVLLSPEFRPYVAEIIIEGHTDSSGKAGDDPYLYNLELSQQRALSVSNYVLSKPYMSQKLRLNESDMKALLELITASGRSYSALKYNADGTEDKVASRRVEIKFRLKDDETVATTEALLRLMDRN